MQWQCRRRAKVTEISKNSKNIYLYLVIKAPLVIFLQFFDKTKIIYERKNMKMCIVTKFQVSIFRNEEVRGWGQFDPNASQFDYLTNYYCKKIFSIYALKLFYYHQERSDKFEYNSLSYLPLYLYYVYLNIIKSVQEQEAI